MPLLKIKYIGKIFEDDLLVEFILTILQILFPQVFFVRCITPK